MNTILHGCGYFLVILVAFALSKGFGTWIAEIQQWRSNKKRAAVLRTWGRGTQESVWGDRP